jgi:hypothetical protein
MRHGKALGLAVLAVAILALWAAPAAEACCIPCNPWCKTMLEPDDYCCTGIPEPGNACGLTICGKYLKSHDVAIDAADFAEPLLTPAIQNDCAKGAPTFLAPIDEIVVQEETEEAES